MNLRRLTLVLLILFGLANLYAIFARGILAAFLVPLIGLTFAVLHAGQREGWKGALVLLGLVFVVSLFFESLGVATGWVYGPYHYTARLGPKFLGLVPFIIPVAWFMMSYPSFIIAEWLVPGAPGQNGSGAGRRILAVAAVGGLVMTAWDVVMDPIMVAGGHWVWDVQGPYYGIPLQNFWGWWLTVFSTYGLYLLVRGRVAQPRWADPAFDRMAMLAYLATTVSTVCGALLAGSGDLGLIGFFSMVPWVLVGLLRLSDRTAQA